MSSHKPILLVEDNPDDEALCLRALRQHRVGNPILVARDGVEALEILLREGAESARPCLVLLDLKLPRIDGLEVLRRLRANPGTRLLPVVVLTSSREERDVVAGYESGANGYVVKPVDFEAFSDAVKQLHLYWVVLNHAPPEVPP